MESSVGAIVDGGQMEVAVVATTNCSVSADMLELLGAKKDMQRCIRLMPQFNL